MLLSAHPRVACGALCIAPADVSCLPLTFWKEEGEDITKGCSAGFIYGPFVATMGVLGGFKQLDISATTTKGL